MPPLPVVQVLDDVGGKAFMQIASEWSAWNRSNWNLNEWSYVCVRSFCVLSAGTSMEESVIETNGVIPPLKSRRDAGTDIGKENLW